MHAQLSALISEYPDILQLHGFYVNKETRNVSFDVILDFGCTRSQQIREELIRKMHAAFPAYTFHVTLDHDFSD